MGLHEALHDSEPQPQTALRTITALPFLRECVEAVRHHLGSDAGARVSHAQPRLIVVFLRADLDSTSGLGVSGRVRQDVRHDL